MLAVAVGADAVRVPVALDRVRRIAHGVLRAEGIRDALVSIAFVTSPAIARLNRLYLGHRGPTDVVAFRFAPLAPHARTGSTRRPRADAVIGDVYIAPAIARKNATRWGVGVREELARLVVHGVLHVVGYDHPLGDDRADSPMWHRQEGLLRRLESAAR
jgi:probable rRNA maturation factor